MPLDSYSDLQTAILSWLARPGDPLVSPAVPDIIRLFEREAARRLKTGAAEKRAQLHALSAAVDLPQDFAELRLATSGGVNLSYVPPMQLPNLGGMPGHYTIIGNAMYLGPSPSGEAFIDIIYQSGVPPLSDANPTNWLLTKHPDCYLFGSLVEAEAFIGHDERIALWASRLQAAFESIESADRKARWNGSPLQIRADAVNGSGGGSAAGDWSGAPPVPIPITGIIAGTGLTGGGTEALVTIALQVPVPVNLGGSGATTVAGAPWAGRVVTDAVAPSAPQDGDLWWDTRQLYVWSDEGAVPAWMPATDAAKEVATAASLADQTSGILVPYYLAPTGSAYTDTNVQRLLGLMRQYHDVPVRVIVNPNNGPGSTFSTFYAQLITLLQAAGGQVLGYVATGFGTRAESLVKADIDLWQSLYAATPVDGIFLDEMPWDTGPGNVGSEYVDRYKMYTDYCHDRGLSPTVGNPGTNQQPAWFSTYTADVIVVHEDLTWPSEASMQGNYAGGHADYSYERRAALVYNQSSLDTALLATLRKNVQWVYVTDDNLTGGALNPWDALPTYLEQLFAAISPTNFPQLPARCFVGDTPPASPVQGDMWFDSTSAQTYVWYNDGTSAQWVIMVALPPPSISPYFVGFSFVGGVLGASQLLGLHKVTRASSIPANFLNSVAGATANATALTVIDVAQALAASPNTFTSIGTITIAAGSVTPTFTTVGGTAKTLAIGDVVRVMGPATADATLANFYCTLVGQ